MIDAAARGAPRTRRWLARVAASFGGFVTTLALIIALAEFGARPQANPAKDEDEPAILELGKQPGDVADAVFPLEQYVVHGQMQWQPVLHQWRDAEFMEQTKADCRLEFAADEPSTTCGVEYAFTTGLTGEALPAHRVRHVRAAVRPGKSPECQQYVRCRMSGYLGAALALPATDRELVVLHRVLYDGGRPTDEELRSEVRALKRSLAKPDPPDFATLPAPVQRMQRLLDLEKAQRLHSLLDESKRRG
jgi:hypothetical protein